MFIAFPVIPVSDLRYKAKEILAQVADQPVVITQRGRAAAVLVDFDAYNQMVRRLGILEEIRDEAAMLAAQAHLEQMDFAGLDALTDLYQEKLAENLPSSIAA
jgi:prevent-host-death family protein